MLEADELRIEKIVWCEGRIDHAIERERSDASRKKVGVVLAEESSVRKAEIGQLLVAERGADHVHVPRRAYGVDEGKDTRAARLAAGGEVLVGVYGRLLFVRIIEDGIERVERVLLRPIETSHRSALADSAGIESDEVESRVEVCHSAPLAAEELDA